jgi:hypothetical protein
MLDYVTIFCVGAIVGILIAYLTHELPFVACKYKRMLGKSDAT